MATQRSLILYPDGSSVYVKAARRDEMIIRGEIERIDSYRYKYVAQKRSYHTFQEFGSDPKLKPLSSSERARYIEGNFVTVRGDKRYYEHALETANGLALRLQSQPISA